MNALARAGFLSTLVLAACADDAAVDDALAVGLEAAPAAASRDCVAPWGIDWNDALSIHDAAIVSPFCTSVGPGKVFTPEVKWITNTENGFAGHPVLYPPGYEPSVQAPIVDFIVKLRAVRYVVHPIELEFVFSPNGIEELLTVGDLYRGSTTEGFTPDEYVWPSLSLLGKLPGLPPGEYSAEVHFVLDETTCDGQTTDFDASCLPPGDTLVATRKLTVRPK